METVREIQNRAFNKMYGLSDQELIEVDDTLNGWDWDERLGPEPEDWKRLPWYKHNIFGFNKKHVKTRLNIVDPLMHYIETKVSRKAILRYHHVHNLGRTEQQFEDWWQSSLMKII
jgi:hypothetical protein